MAVFSLPVLNYRAIRPAAPADLVVMFKDTRSRKEIEGKVLQIVDKFMFYAGIWEQQGIYSLIVPNPATATDIIEEVRKLPGIELRESSLLTNISTKLEC